MNQPALKADGALTLNAQNLSKLPQVVQRPAYDWARTQTGIVHISLGAFHRSHQAMYTDNVLALEAGAWGICGIGALPSDDKLINNLKNQDFLYSVATRDAGG